MKKLISHKLEERKQDHDSDDELEQLKLMKRSSQGAPNKLNKKDSLSQFVDNLKND